MREPKLKTDMILEDHRLKLQKLIQNYCDKWGLILVDTYGGNFSSSEYGLNIVRKKDYIEFCKTAREEREKVYASNALSFQSYETYKELIKEIYDKDYEKKYYVIRDYSKERKYFIQNSDEEEDGVPLSMYEGTYDECVAYVKKCGGYYERWDY